METYSFEWDGNHPAADFVNTYDERLSPHPLERLDSYTALIEFARQAGLIGDDTAARLHLHASSRTGNEVLSATRQLREALYAVLLATSAGQRLPEADIRHIENAIRQAREMLHLSWSGAGFDWSWREPENPGRPLWELALATENLLLSADARRIKKCAASDCGVIFLDHSKAGSRRWCSMAACGNRNKVRRFRSIQPGPAQ